VIVVLLILQKSIKPLQLVLNDFFKKLDNGVSVTKSAFREARRHLKAAAFITLNHKVGGGGGFRSALPTLQLKRDKFNEKFWGSSDFCR